MPNVLLLFEHSQHGANGGITGRFGKLSQDLGSGGASATVKHIHDLPLAPAELVLGN
jgi:hypothetical protein